MIELSEIIISGKDNFNFLQGQLTCDMCEVHETPHHGALCNLKGRVIVSFKIQKNQNDYSIILPTVMCSIFINSLKKYAQFSEVTFSEPTAYSQSLDLLSSLRDKIAVILPETSEKFTPHELNYHNLGFISFTKGCYRGQEIIARMQYLGKLKKQLAHMTVNTLEEVKGEIVNSIKIGDHYEVLAVLTFSPIK